MATTLLTYRGTGSDLCYVIASVDSRVLPRLREALKHVGACSVIVSAAISWTDVGRVLCYRGERLLLDLDVARIEITCAEQHVEDIVASVQRVLRSDRASTRPETSVAAFQTGSSFASTVPELS